jgi:hypothetical protein
VVNKKGKIMTKKLILTNPKEQQLKFVFEEEKYKQDLCKYRKKLINKIKNNLCSGWIIFKILKSKNDIHTCRYIPESFQFPLKAFSCLSLMGIITFNDHFDYESQSEKEYMLRRAEITFLSYDNFNICIPGGWFPNPRYKPPTCRH